MGKHRPEVHSFCFISQDALDITSKGNYQQTVSHPPERGERMLVNTPSCSAVINDCSDQ